MFKVTQTTLSKQSDKPATPTKAEPAAEIAEHMACVFYKGEHAPKRDPIQKVEEEVKQAQINLAAASPDRQ